LLLVGVDTGEVLVLRKGGLRRNAARRSQRALLGRGRGSGPVNVVLVDGFAHGSFVHGVHVAVDQPGLIEAPEDGENAAGAVHVLHVIAGRWRDFANTGSFAGQTIDVRHL